MKYIFSILSLLISINVYSQVNVMDIDTNKTQVNINNYGTLIENNGGKVNIGIEKVEESVKVPLTPKEVHDMTDNAVYNLWTILFFILFWAFVLILPTLHISDYYDKNWLIWIMYVLVVIILSYISSNFILK